MKLITENNKTFKTVKGANLKHGQMCYIRNALGYKEYEGSLAFFSRNLHLFDKAITYFDTDIWHDFDVEIIPPGVRFTIEST